MAAPIATDFFVNISNGSTATIPVVFTGFDPDGGPVAVTQVSNQVNVSVAFNPALPFFQLTTTGGPTGSFDYVITDNASQSDSGHVDVGVLTTNASANTLSVATNAAASWLEGRDGNDYLRGRDGFDFLFGGTSAGSAADGDDRLYGYDGDDSLDGGSGADRLLGGTGKDKLVGGAGNDVLDGGIGRDTMQGGIGDDIYYVDDALDVVTEGSDAGIDRVYFRIDGTLSANVEQGYLQGPARIVSGNILDNTLFGGAGNDTLSGAGGKDSVYGNAGQDTLNGDAGDDRLEGGLGLDKLFGGADNDRLEGGDDRDTLDGGAGIDILIGGAARDFMTGGLGGDRFIFDDGDFEGGTATLADRILDYDYAEGDRLDLTRIDANTNTIVDDKFTFIGGSTFSGVAGQLRFQTLADGNTYVFGDTDGNGTANLAIRLEGVVNFTIPSSLL